MRSPLAVVQGAGEHHLAHFPHGSGWNGVGAQKAPRRAVRPLFTMDKGLAPCGGLARCARHHAASVAFSRGLR